MVHYRITYRMPDGASSTFHAEGPSEDEARSRCIAQVIEYLGARYGRQFRMVDIDWSATGPEVGFADASATAKASGTALEAPQRLSS